MDPRKPISYFDFLADQSSLFRKPEAAYMIDRVRDGLPFAEFHVTQKLLRVTEKRLGVLLGMSCATLHRRKKVVTLDRAKLDRLVRYARLLTHAMAAMSGLEGARSWLISLALGFNGERPLDYAEAEIGAREVDVLLGRLEHGVFS